MITGSGGTTILPSPSERDFDRARKKAAVQDLLSVLRFDSADLLPFETVRQRLGLGQGEYRGVQTIPLDQIVGSVGRHSDFTRTFLPRTDRIRDRWQRLDWLKNVRGTAPIEAYKVGQVYFVLDGNHRVSVARQAGASTVEGHIWEFETRVPLEPDDSLRDVLVRQEYLEFLERTQLDKHRPDVYIILTGPGRYREFEEQIAIHRHYLELERGQAVGFQDAAVHWYDQVYLPMIQVIHRDELLRHFPGRTAADLVSWVIRNRDRLRQRYGAKATVSDLVSQEFPGLGNISLRRRLLSWFRRTVLRWPVYTGKPWQPPER
jgi:hypothetical protein